MVKANVIKRKINVFPILSLVLIRSPSLIKRYVMNQNLCSLIIQFKSKFYFGRLLLLYKDFYQQLLKF